MMLGLGQRRASSAGPIGSHRMWTVQPPPTFLQRDHSPLPEADTTLFEPSFLASSSFGFAHVQEAPFQNFNEFFPCLPPHARAPHDLDLSQNISPLDRVDPSKPIYDHNNGTNSSNHVISDLDPLSLSWLPATDPTIHSDPSSTYSGSPTPSDEVSLPVHAPKPQHPEAPFEAGVWTNVTPPSAAGFEIPQGDMTMRLALDYSAQPTQSAPCGDMPMQSYTTGLEGLFDPSYSMSQGNNGNGTHDMTILGFDITDMVHDSY